VARSRPTEKIDNAAFPSGVLIAKDAKDSARLEHFIGLTGAIAFRQQSLAHRLAMTHDEPVEVGVIKCASDRVRAKAPEIAHMPQRLEVSEMARHADLWARPASDVNPL